MRQSSAFDVEIAGVREWDMDRIWSIYGDAEAAFSSGNFALVALREEAPPELLGCALIMNGVAQRGLDLFRESGVTTCRSRIFAAFAHWYLGDSEAAIKCLELVSDPDWAPIASKFADALKCSKLNILLFNHTSEKQFAFPDDSQIAVKRIGYSDKCSDYQITLDTNLDSFFEGLPPNDRPDLLLSSHPNVFLPDGFADCRVPKVMWVNDHEMFLTSKSGEFNS